MNANLLCVTYHCLYYIRIFLLRLRLVFLLKQFTVRLLLSNVIKNTASLKGIHAHCTLVCERLIRHILLSVSSLSIQLHHNT